MVYSRFYSTNTPALRLSFLEDNSQISMCDNWRHCPATTQHGVASTRNWDQSNWPGPFQVLLVMSGDFLTHCTSRQNNMVSVWIRHSGCQMWSNGRKYISKVWIICSTRENHILFNCCFLYVFSNVASTIRILNEIIWKLMIYTNDTKHKFTFKSTQ